MRTVPISGFAELASEFLPESFSLPSRAIALDQLSGASKGVVFSRIIADTDHDIQMEGTYSFPVRSARLNANHLRGCLRAYEPPRTKQGSEC